MMGQRSRVGCWVSSTDYVNDGSDYALEDGCLEVGRLHGRSGLSWDVSAEMMKRDGADAGCFKMQKW